MHTFILSASKAYLRHYTGIPREAWHGIALSFIESTLVGLFYFLSIYFIQDLDINIAMAGSIISFYGLGAMIGGMISGKLSDRISSNKIARTSIIIQAFGYFALIYLHNTHLLAFTVFILGIASYSFITANQLSVLRKCEKNNSPTLRAINLLSSASNLGLAISAIIISSFIGLGFHALFFMTGFSLFLIAIYLFAKDASKSSSESPIIIHENSDTNKSVIAKHSLINPVMMLVLASVLLVGIIVAQLSACYPVYIKNNFSSLGLKGLSILFALNSIIIVLFETPIGNYLNQYNKIMMVGVGGFLIGAGMFLLCLSDAFIFALISCVIYTFGEIIFFCMAQYVCYEQSAVNKKGTNLGMFRATYAFSRLLGPVTGGFIYYHYSGEMLWILCGMIGVLCLLTCMVSSRA